MSKAQERTIPESGKSWSQGNPIAAKGLRGCKAQRGDGEIPLEEGIRRTRPFGVLPPKLTERSQQEMAGSSSHFF